MRRHSLFLLTRFTKIQKDYVPMKLQQKKSEKERKPPYYIKAGYHETVLERTCIITVFHEIINIIILFYIERRF